MPLIDTVDPMGTTGSRHRYSQPGLEAWGAHGSRMANRGSGKKALQRAERLSGVPTRMLLAWLIILWAGRDLQEQLWCP